MKKRVIFAVLLLSCALIASCGSDENESTQVDTSTSETTTETEAESEAVELIPVETETEEVVEIDYEGLFFEQYWEIDTPSVRQYLEENPESAGDYTEVAVDNLDGSLDLQTVNGDKILDIDQKNNVVLIEIHGSTYVAKLLLVKDPSQLELKKASSSSKGDRIADYGAKYDPVFAVNASGFPDSGGTGNGGKAAGCMIIDGVDYGTSFHTQRKFYGMNYDNKFVMTDYKNVTVSEYRWGFQFHPQLVVDGKYANDEGFGGSNQPRTVGGQAEDGTFLILVVDGRQSGYSQGASVKECANVVISYGAVTAGNFDGGSSSILWYKGKQITKPSSTKSIGRALPNALILKKAE